MLHGGGGGVGRQGPDAHQWWHPTANKAVPAAKRGPSSPPCAPAQVVHGGHGNEGGAVAPRGQQHLQPNFGQAWAAGKLGAEGPGSVGGMRWVAGGIEGSAARARALRLRRAQAGGRCAAAHQATALPYARPLRCRRRRTRDGACLGQHLALWAGDGPLGAGEQQLGAPQQQAARAVIHLLLLKEPLVVDDPARSALLCFSRQGRGGAGCRKGMRCSCIPRPSTTQRTGRPACRRGGRTGSAS